MCSPCPYKGDPVYEQLHALADAIAERLRPHTPAYHELWLTDPVSGQRQPAGGAAGEVVEPIYGPTYLPRKFKTGIALPGDNSADVYSQDLGLLAIAHDWKVVGYNVVVGGGFGVTPSAKKTFPAVALPFGFVQAVDAVDLAEAIVRVQRDYGNRSDRKVARDEVPHPPMGNRTLSRESRRILRPRDRPTSQYRSAGPQRRHGLASPRGWPLVLRAQCREWQNQGRGRISTQVRPARNLPTTQA